MYFEEFLESGELIVYRVHYKIAKAMTCDLFLCKSKIFNKSTI